MEYVGIDWAYRRAAWCALGEGGAVSGEGVVAADEDGLARLVLELGSEVRACVEMMSGAVWVRDQLAAVGWRVEVAHARKVRDIAPLACKTDEVDARVLAELCRRSGCRRWRSARCASNCGGACTWFACAPGR
jgi:transposase